jgi:opacity protein-like surface antigen
MSFRKTLLATALLAVPGIAAAQPVSGVYIAAGAGVNWLQESDVELSRQFGGTNASRSGTAEFDLGWVGVISLGYGFGNGVRAEIEGSYRENEVDTVSGFPGLARPLRSDGTARSYGVMANAFYDFDFGINPAGFSIQPYVGVGAGYIWHEYDGTSVRAGNGPVVSIDGEDGRFAYQAIVGVATQLTSIAPGLALTAEYRFMGTLQPELDATLRASPGGPVLARGNAEVDNYNHSILIGLRYAFGATPPPPVAAPVAPAPAPAPAPARTYLVFFDFDRADLTDRARQIIAEAAHELEPRADDADRGGGPRRPLRHAAVQPAPVAAPRGSGGGGAGAPRHLAQPDGIQAFGESRPLVADRRRRARAAEPPRRDRAPLRIATRPFPAVAGKETGWGPSRAPTSRFRSPARRGSR